MTPPRRHRTDVAPQTRLIPAGQARKLVNRLRRDYQTHQAHAVAAV
ncbi:hypothetical protein [Schlesneria sp. T3-172]